MATQAADRPTGVRRTALVTALAVLLGGCVAGGPGGPLSPATRSPAPLSPTPAPSAVPSPSASATVASPASAGVSVRYVQGSDSRFDVRLYEIDRGVEWTESSPFRLSAGLYQLTGQCGGFGGKALGVKILLQRVRAGDGAVAQEYRWHCGPVETFDTFGELRRLAEGDYRLAVQDDESGGTVEIGPAPADAYLDPAAAVPAAPGTPRAVSSVVPCPPAAAAPADPSPGTPCVVFDLSWSPSASPASYRIYEAWRMPGTPLPPCDPATAVLSIATSGGPGPRTGVYVPVEAQGACFWVAAANGAGESEWVEAAVVIP